MSTASRELHRNLDYTRKTNTAIESVWSGHFSGVADYEENFKPILDGYALPRLLEQWDPADTAVLDFMGYGEALHDLGVRHGLAVALSDARDATQKAKHGKAISVIEGNVLESGTWHKIDQWLATNTPNEDQHFKMILSCPIGGINTLPKNISNYYILIDRLYRRLSDSNGEMLLAVDTDFKDDKLTQWINLLQTTKGITFRQSIPVINYMSRTYRKDTLRITKHVDAPKRLPALE